MLGWKVLPVTGRPGPAPDWPLPVSTDRETWHWVRVWRTPQATEWEKLGQLVEVALYVRVLTRAEALDAPLAAIDKARQLGEALGLTIPGLLRNRWQIGGGTKPKAEEQSTGTDGKPAPRRTGSARGRLTVVSTDGD